MIPVVAFVGRTNAGKTTVLERTVAALRQRGYRVGVIKHSHHGVELDTQGADTWRLTKAGGDPVALASQGRLWLTGALPDDGPEPVVDRWMRDVDIVLCEGYKGSACPKVEVHRSVLGGDLLCKPAEMVALVTDRPFPFQVPQFSPDDTAGLVRLLEETYLRPSRQGESVEVVADGRRVPLGEFAQQIVARTLLGLTSAFKGVGSPERLEITVRRSKGQGAASEAKASERSPRASS